MALYRGVVGRSSVLGSLNVTIASALSCKYSTRVHSTTPQHHPQGANRRSDDVSSKIRKSLDNDDGRDYEGGSRGSGEDVSGFVAEKAMKGARKTTETAFNAAGAVAEGMEQTWGAVKETSEKLKDAVLGDEHERAQNNRRNDKAADDHLNNNSGDNTKWHA